MNIIHIDESLNTASFGSSETTYEVPRTALLDGFVQLSEVPESLDVRRLAVQTRLVLRTQNTEYRFTLLDPLERRARVCGGSYFAEPAEVIVAGASVGGALLKVGWIVQGMQLELLNCDGAAEMRSIITSPVSMFYLEPA